MLFFPGFVCFKTFFQIAQRLKAMTFVFANPPLVDLVQRHWIQIVQLLAPAPNDGHQLRFLKQKQMLRHCLARHVQMLTQLRQGLAVVLEQLIQKLSAACIRQRFEHCIHRQLEYATQRLHVNCIFDWSISNCFSVSRWRKHRGLFGKLAGLSRTLDFKSFASLLPIAICAGRWPMITVANQAAGV
jgi:hypothetical protein